MARSSSGDISTKETRKWLRKDELFSRISAVSGILLLGGLTNDVVQYTIGKPLLTTQSFTYIALVVHVITFIMSILGFVYTTSRYKRRSDRISCLLIVFNGLIFVLRVVLELVLINYRREYYNS